MELRELIAELEKRDPNQVVQGFDGPHSYRGYYECLAFHPCPSATLGSMLECARAALGTTYEGYKGGDFTMMEYTDCYIACYGMTGDMITRDFFAGIDLQSELTRLTAALKLAEGERDLLDWAEENQPIIQPHGEACGGWCVFWGEKEANGPDLRQALSAARDGEGG